MCVVSWGRMGYRVATDQWGDQSKEGVVGVAESANAMIKVSRERAAEMVHRSVHGWVQDQRTANEQSGMKTVNFAHAGRGHIAFVGEYEYFYDGDGLYRGSLRDCLGEQWMRRGTKVAVLTQGHKWAMIEQVREVHLGLARDATDSDMEGACDDA